MDAIELADRVPVACARVYAFHGTVFNSKFEVCVSVRDVCDKNRVINFTRAFIGSLGGIKNPFVGISQDDLKKVSRLSKVLDRLDKSSYPAERANAFRIIQSNLGDLNLDMDLVHVICSVAFDPSGKNLAVAVWDGEDGCLCLSSERRASIRASLPCLRSSIGHHDMDNMELKLEL